MVSWLQACTSVLWPFLGDWLFYQLFACTHLDCMAMSSGSPQRVSGHRVTALGRCFPDTMCTTVVVGVGMWALSAAFFSGKTLSALNASTNGLEAFYSEEYENIWHIVWLTLAAGGAVVPVTWEAALAVTTSGPRAAWTAVGERMAGGANGGWPAFTPPTALAAGETWVALLDYMNEKHC